MLESPIDKIDSQGNCPTDVDYDSDCDSLMPRRLQAASEQDDSSVATTDLLSLCSGSTASISSTGTSSTAGGAWNFHTPLEQGYPDDESVGSSLPSLHVRDDDDSSVDSIASLETIPVAPMTVTTPSEETLASVRRATIGKKAVRADDADLPVYLWDNRIRKVHSTEERLQAVTTIVHAFRKGSKRVFHRAVCSDCIMCIEDEFGSDWQSLPRKQDNGKWTKLGWRLDGIRNMLWYVERTDFFEYHGGSKTHYFRFPIYYRRLVRDGWPVHFEKPGPSKPSRVLQQTQPHFPDPGVREILKKKVFKVRRRRYIIATTLEDLESIIRYFGVPKGEDDVRIVYDATASGLNDCVWSPSFWLPTVESLLRALDEKSWMADRDMGDMFLNYELHHSAWPFAGVDLTPLMDENEESGVTRWYHWVRNLMGFKPSPYASIKTALVAEEVVRGDRHDPKNPFQWDKVVLNLPGPGYVPTKAWVMKVRLDSELASDLFTFVDDERLTGAGEESTWQAGHTLGAKQAYLGMQDAARKVGECSQEPRAWAGVVVHVVPGKGVCVLTSEEKWRKLKSIVQKYLDLLGSGADHLVHKDLLSDRGFLVYVTRAYPAMVPYLKGFHLTIEMWRGNRDAEGWKLSPKQLSASALPDSLLGPSSEEDAELAYLLRQRNIDDLRAPPSGSTPIAPRLLHDLQALQRLTTSPLPPLRIVRPTKVVQVLYGFGDASGKGFGSTVQGYSPRQLIESPANPRFRVGVWGCDVEVESSNFRELANLVLAVEEEAAAGHLDMSEFFLFTDNSTAESAFHKGSSSSSKLHGLILRLRQLEIRHGITLHIIHVSGKRMIAQGTDGCSRGVLLEGVMVGDDMLSFVDLAKSALDRSPALLSWIQSWCLDSSVQPLTPEDWFLKGHGISGGARDHRGVWIPTHAPSGQTLLWAPPPAAADAALEELLKARHKRTDTTHIIVVPRLMTPRWRRLFHKVADCCFTVAPGADFWPSHMFEPLWVAVVLPFHRHSPWQLQRAPLMVELGRKLHRLCSNGEASGGHLLRKLCKLPRRLASVSSVVARGVLHMPRPVDISPSCSP